MEELAILFSRAVLLFEQIRWRRNAKLYLLVCNLIQQLLYIFEGHSFLNTQQKQKLIPIVRD